MDNFKDGTKFSDVVNLYNFDRKLRLLALDAIERIELAVQVEVAHLLGARDPLAHLDPSQLHTKFSTRKHKDVPSRYEKWLSDYAHLVDRAKRKTFVEHNLAKYGELPIWVAIEVFDLGAGQTLIIKPLKSLTISPKGRLTARTTPKNWSNN